MTKIGPRSGGSPVAAEVVAARRAAFDELSCHDSALYWVESTPRSGDRHVARWTSSSGCERLDPAVGSRLHAYGGGVYVAGDDGVWLVEADDDRVTRLGAAPMSLAGAGAVGDLAWGAGRVWLVREVDGYDLLVMVDAGSGVETAVREAAFLAAPRADVGRLAWVQWSTEVMPWDSAEIWVADLSPDGALTGVVRVAGGDGESVVQPAWGPHGWLYFVSDRDGWWNLYRWRAGRTVAVAPVDGECAVAPWEAGYRSYTFLPDGRIGMLVRQGPYQRLAVVDQGRVSWLETPYTSIKPYLAACGDRLALIGASGTRSAQVALVAADGSGRVEVIRDGTDPAVDGARIVQPEVLQVPGSGGLVTALVYPAAGIRSVATIVRVHPGPTHHNELRLDWQVQYFTSRGFTVVDVDYRGSTGYGRAFRTALNGAWGRYDVEDCVTVAEYLIRTGVARTGAVFIAGASAGGYTALRAVTRADTPFTLAAVRSAIVDPGRWRQSAPRFQRAHAAVLASPDAGIDAGAVRRPVLLVHGDADPIAPVAAVISLATALQGRGMLAGLVRLSAAGHDISGEALVRTLDAEIAAYTTALSATPGPGPRVG